MQGPWLKGADAAGEEVFAFLDEVFLCEIDFVRASCLDKRDMALVTRAGVVLVDVREDLWEFCAKSVRVNVVDFVAQLTLPG
jgi:hypothetical protein